MRDRSWFDRLFRGKSRGRQDAPPVESLYCQPQLRRLEDRRVLSAGAITVDAGANQSGIVEGSSVSLAGATFTDAAPGGNLPHVAEIDWGDGTVEPGIVTEPDGSDPGTVTGTHTYADDGSYTVKVSVEGADLSSLDDTATIAVLNHTPENLILSAVPGGGGTFTLEGTFEDSGTLDTHTVKIDWGDGSVATFFALPVGERSFSATHTYADPTMGTPGNPVTILAGVEDDDGGLVVEDLTLPIPNVAPTNVEIDLTPSPADENQSVTLTGTFEDANPYDNHSVTIDWGDGSALEVLTLTQGDRGFSATHTYLDDGPKGANSFAYTVTATVDDGAETASVTENITINNVAPHDVAVSLDATEIDENGTVTLSGNFVDPGTQDTHEVVIDWGNGDSTTLNLVAGQTTFEASYTYEDDTPSLTTFDDYTINVTVNDDDTGSSSDSTDVRVNNVPPQALSISLTPTAINENGTVTLEGSFADIGPLDSHTVEINWGDGSANTVIALTMGEKAFTATHTYLDDPDGTDSPVFNVLVTVTDDDTGNVTATTTAEVYNVPPENLLLSLSDLEINEDGSITLEGTFDDPGSEDAHEVVIDWGDGSPPTTILLNSGEREFSINHQYLDDPAGIGNDDFTIDVSVTDDDSTVAAEASAVVTVHNVDPSIDSLSIAPVLENQTATLTGTYSDVGTLDTHTVDIDWDGDGVYDELGLTVSGGSFTFTHLYADDNPTGTPSDTFNVNVRLHDDDGGQNDSSVSQTVTNVGPSLSDVSATAITENGTTTLTGTIADASPEDSFTLTVNWGDPLSPDNIETYSFAAGTTSFTLTHQYLDDNPTGTPSDDYTINLSLVDDDDAAAIAMDSTTVNVSNVNPKIDSLSITPINENQTATLTGTYSDVGTLDTHKIDIDWDGDGVYDELGLAVSGGSFTFSHLYVDDNPSGTPSDTFNVNVLLHDDDGGQHEASVSQTVTNVSPTISDLVATAINENGTTTLTGTITDASPEDSFTLTVNWGDPLSPNNIETYTFAAGTTSFTLTHQYLDDNPTATGADNYTINLSLVDDDDLAAVATASTTVAVTNVNPKIDSLSITPVNENQTAALTGTYSDVGTLDTHTVDIDWDGDGVYDELGLAVSGGSFTFTHLYVDDNPSGTPSDTFNVNVRLHDDDGGQDESSVSQAVTNVSPSLSNLASTAINENGTTTLTGTITDASPEDSFTLTVNWGDPLSPNNIETYTFVAGTTSFTLTHQYLDDNPTNSSSDSYTIGLTLKDDDTGQNVETTSVTISNVSPVISNLSATAINENGSTTLTGTFTDPGLLDTHAVIVDWDDPNNATDSTFALGATNGLAVGNTFASSTDGAVLMITSVDLATGTIGFSVQHQYLDDGGAPGNGTPGDTSTIGVTVRDDDTGQDVETTAVTVSNVAPVISNLSATAINENEISTLTGTITNPGLLDTHTMVVDWDDPNNATNSTFALTATNALTVGDTFNSSTDSAVLTITAVDLATGTIGFSVQHQYLDDGLAPGNTTSGDASTISVTVTDDDTGADTETTTVAVSNVSPILGSLSATTISENGTSTLTGTITDPGTLDAFTLTVNWGDPLSPNNIETYTFAAGTTSFTLTHQYLDDNPTGDSTNQYTIGLTLKDDDTGQDVESTSVIVNNVAPVLTLESVTAISENGVATLAGTFTDPGRIDTHSVLVDWDDPNNATNSTFALTATNGLVVGNTFASSTDGAVLTITAVDLSTGTISFSVQHQYLDDGGAPGNNTANDISTISVTVTDDDTGAVTETTTVAVSNVSPNLIEVVGDNIDENGVATVTAIISDSGSLDVFTVVVNWQDGTPANTITGLGLTDATGTVGGTSFTWDAETRSLTLSHQYLDDGTFPGNDTANDTYLVTLAVNDDDLGGSATTATVVVNNVNPDFINIVGATINEDSVATITTNLSDPGSKDVFAVTVDWQDLTPADTISGLGLVDSAGTVGGTSYTWDAETRSLTLSHQYLDDGPFPGNSTSSDTYNVSLTARDDDQGQGDRTAAVVVNNVNPSQVVFTANATVINETESISISGTFADTGRQDQHTLMVDWGDGSPLEAITVFTSANGAGTFSATHLYLDDNPTGFPSDLNTIRVYVTDDDLGVGVGETSITVNDLAPTILTLGATQLDITGMTTVTGTFTDPGTVDTFRVQFEWGDGTIDIVDLPAESGSFQISHQYLAPPDPINPANDIPITITVLDDDLLSDTQITLADVPGRTIFGAAIVLRAETPPLQFPVTANVAPTTVVAPPPLSSVRTFEDRRTGVEAVVGADRRVVLRTVSIDGEEGNEAVLPEKTLDDMKGLFSRLPDGRYRIYLRQDKIERLMLDVYVRQGKPVDPENESDGTLDRPPTSQANPQQPDEEESKETSEKSEAEPDDAVSAAEMDWSKPARLLRELRRRVASC